MTAEAASRPHPADDEMGRPTDEAVVIAGLIATPQIYRLADYLSPSDFSGAVEQSIYAAIQSTVQTGNPITPHSIHAIARNVPLETIMRYARSHAGNSEAVRAAAERLADRQRGLRLVERLREAARQIRHAMDQGHGWEGAFGRGLHDCVAIAQSRHRATGDAARRRVLATARSGFDVIRTGIEPLDAHYGGGLRPGTLLVIASRPKRGKSIFCTTVSHNLDQQGVRHLYITLQNTPEQIETLKLARHMNIAPRDITQSLLEMDMPAMPDSSTAYYAKGAATADEVRCQILNAVHMHQTRCVILDYFQLIGGRGRQPMELHLDETATMLRRVVTDHGLVMIMTAMMNDVGKITYTDHIISAATDLYELQRDITVPNAYLNVRAASGARETDIGSYGNPSLILHQDRAPHISIHPDFQSARAASKDDA